MPPPFDGKEAWRVQQGLLGDQEPPAPGVEEAGEGFFDLLKITVLYSEYNERGHTKGAPPPPPNDVRIPPPPFSPKNKNIREVTLQVFTDPPECKKQANFRLSLSSLAR